MSLPTDIRRILFLDSVTLFVGAFFHTLCFQSAGLGQVPLSSVTRTVSHSAPSINESSNKSRITVSGWPHQVTVGQFRIHSLVPISELERVLPSIARLPHELRDALGIDITSATIDVVVLQNRSNMEEYAKRLVSNPPSHRALYIRNRGPGLVLTYFSSEWIYDVRHECTHALLDASQMELPIWQDEGLAEYFETDGRPPCNHRDHLNAIKSQVRYGQIADLERFEHADQSVGLDAKGYRDAWSAIAFILHGSLESRRAYQDYLRDVQNKRAAGFLSHRMRTAIPSWHEAYNAFFRAGKPRSLQ